MIDRRILCIGAMSGPFLAASTPTVLALPSARIGESIDTQWSYAQALPPIAPLSDKDYVDQKAFGQYLSDNAYNRLAKAGVEVTGEAKSDIQQVIDRSAEAAFRSQK